MSKPTYQILIVDDSAEDRYTFRRKLLSIDTHEFVVIEAASGTEGLAQCHAAKPDCVLLDYILPDLNGVEFIRRLRDEFVDCEPAVVMLTGLGSESLAVEALKAGAQDYLVKGLEQDRIFQAVLQAIQGRSQRQQIQAQALQLESLAAEREALIEQLKQRATGLSREREALIGELGQRAAELTQADRRKDEFLATLAHELRNPLAPIRSAMHLVETTYPDDPQAAALRHVVERQVSHLTRLVDDLMDVARITSGKVELKRETVSLAAVMAHAVEITRPLFHSHRHTIEVAAPGDSVWLDVDPVRVVQILANILANASKYTLQAGIIAMTAHVDDAQIVFTISDPGMGMEQESLSKIFDTFVQIAPALGQASSGLGIGLSLAKQFAEMHGGSIRASSPGLLLGSQFVVTLPVITGEPRIAPVSGLNGAPADAKASPSKLQILVVDDNVDGANMLELLFESSGFAVTTVYNGIEAIAKVRQCRPDVIVMDLGMPGMDGYEAIRQIRVQPGAHAILAIALTGWNQDDTKHRTADAGFNHHLVKPVDFGKLKHLIEAH